MALQNIDQLNETHIDILREIGNIGAGNAATSLSQMLQTEVDMKVPSVRILDINDAVSALGGPENVVEGIMVKLCGDIDGMIMFIIQQEFAATALTALLGSSDISSGKLSEMELSAISEIGNIMISSYVNSINTLTGLFVNHSVPSVAVDMVGAVISTAAIEMSSVSDKTIFIEDDFLSNEKDISANIMLWPTMESLNKLLHCLGIEL